MAAKKLKAGKKRVASPASANPKKKTRGKKSTHAAKRSLVPKKKAARAAAQRPQAVESAPEPAVLPTPFATFTF